MENYEQKYKEALEKLRNLHDNYDSISSLVNFKEELEGVFTELKESKDEKIIKALKEGFKYHQLLNPTFGGIPCTEIVNWLEKQREQKPAWSEEDEQLIDEVAVCLRKYEEKVQGGYSKSYVQSLADRIESLRPGNTCKATGWSEEDEERYLSCLKRLGTGDIRHPETINTVWLKSIKDRIK